jgi:hypothetical protein
MEAECAGGLRQQIRRVSAEDAQSSDRRCEADCVEEGGPRWDDGSGLRIDPHRGVDRARHLGEWTSSSIAVVISAWDLPITSSSWR